MLSSQGEGRIGKSWLLDRQVDDSVGGGEQMISHAFQGRSKLGYPPSLNLPKPGLSMQVHPAKVMEVLLSLMAKTLRRGSR